MRKVQIIDPVTGQPEELSMTKRYADDLTQAVRESGITDSAEMIKYWKWYANSYARLYIKTVNKVKSNEGVTLAKMICYLAKKIGNKTATTSIGPKISSLYDQGFLSNADYEKYFKIFPDATATRDATGIIVKDFSTFNVMRHRWELCQILDESEGLQVVSTFVEKPWLHVSAQTNFLLWELLSAKIHKMAERETGLKIARLYLRRKFRSGGATPFMIQMTRDGFTPSSESQEAIPQGKEFGGKGTEGEEPSHFKPLG